MLGIAYSVVNKTGINLIITQTKSRYSGNLTVSPLSPLHPQQNLVWGDRWLPKES